MIITRKEFQAYLRVQRKGEYNMYDPQAMRDVQSIIPMTKEVYDSIQKNYPDLQAAFIGTNINYVQITVYDKEDPIHKAEEERAEEYGWDHIRDIRIIDKDIIDNNLNHEEIKTIWAVLGAIIEDHGITHPDPHFSVINRINDQVDYLWDHIIGQENITLYQAFQTEYPFITISKENFEKAYKEAGTANLDLLKDYILAKGLEEEVQL